MISRLIRYLAELRKIQTAGLGSTNVISNPINAFHLMKRLTILWDKVKASLVANTSIGESIIHSLFQQTEIA